MNRGNNLLDVENIHTAYSNLFLGTASRMHSDCVDLSSFDSHFIIDSLSFNNQTSSGFLKVNSSNQVVTDPTSFWFLTPDQGNISASIFNYSDYFEYLKVEGENYKYVIK